MFKPNVLGKKKEIASERNIAIKNILLEKRHFYKLGTESKN